MEPADNSGDETVERDATRPGMSPQLAELHRRISRVRAEGLNTVDAATLLQDLETAHEELRVADEEVRSQQEQIAGLLASHRLTRWQHERVLAALPVAVLTTNRRGLMQSVNAAAAGLMNMGVDAMLRTPIFVLVAEADRHLLREEVARLSRDGGSFQHVVSLLPRDRDPVVREAFGSMVERELDAEITWVLLAATPESRETLEEGSDLPRALVRLTTLASLGVAPEGVVQRAAELCQRALGDRVSLSVLVGAPDAPQVVATTSKIAQDFDGAQMTAGEGPSRSCYEAGALVVSSDARSDSRWTRLLPSIASLPIGAVVAAPIRHGDDVVGALSVYGAPGAEPAPRLQETTELLATAVASVLQEIGMREELETLASDMQTALLSRAVIDQAKGIVMADRRCTADEAFEHLVRLSSTRHMKLRDVAESLVQQASSRGGPTQ